MLDYETCVPSWYGAVCHLLLGSNIKGPEIAILSCSSFFHKLKKACRELSQS